jgi:hypothetical protein
MNSVLAVAVVCCQVVALIYIPINLHLRLNENNTEDLLKITTLIEGFKTKEVKTRFYYLLFLFQRFISAGSYSFLISYPGLQCLSISIPIGLTCILYLVLYILIA